MLVRKHGVAKLLESYSNLTSNNSGIRLLTKVFLTSTDAVGLRPKWLPDRTNFTVTPAQTGLETVTYGLEYLGFESWQGQEISSPERLDRLWWPSACY